MRKRYPFQRSWRWTFVCLFDWLTLPIQFFLRKKKIPTHVRNIIVLRLDQIGDFTCALPAFSILKQRFPYARIHAVGDSFAADLLQNNPNVDRFYQFENNWFSGKGKFRWSSFFRCLRELRSLNADIGVDLRGDLRDILLLMLSGCKYRIGFGIAGGGNLLHDEREFIDSKHEVELNAELAAGTPVARSVLKPEVYITDFEKERAWDILKASGIKKNEPFVAIHPEAGYPSKRWPIENYKALVGRLNSVYPFKIIILGTGEASTLASFFDGSDSVVDLVGQLTLRELLLVLNNALLFIGNDSGPAHIAQALERPVLVISSGTNVYERWGVWREPKRILRFEVPCAPCGRRECNVAGHPCLSQITLEEVMAAVDDLLGPGKKKSEKMERSGEQNGEGWFC